MCYILGRLGFREFWKILDLKNDPKSFKGLTYIDIYIYDWFTIGAKFFELST